MKPVYFIVLPFTQLLDLVGIADAFLSANRLNGAPIVSCRYVGGGNTVPTSIGLSLSAVERYPDRIEEDAWIVISGVINADQNLQSEAVNEAVRWLRRVTGVGNKICCVCGGAFVAGAAGLLDGRLCTTHHDDCDALKRAFPAARVQENRIFVEDGPLCSSAGVTSGIDLALYLITEAAGGVLAGRVARELVVYIRRAGADPQISPWLEHRNHINPKIHRVQEAIAREPAFRWTIDSLAAIAHTSGRNLSRIFISEAGITPLDYVGRIRLTVARELVKNTSWPIERVAQESGFGSAHQLRRAWRQEEELSPGQFRSQKRMPAISDL